MGKFKLQPREFRLRAGARTELDRLFLQIVGNLSEETNLSEFIKTAVVEHFQEHHKMSEIDLLHREFIDLFERFHDLKLELHLIEAKQSEVEKVAQIKADLNAFKEEMKDI